MGLGSRRGGYFFGGAPPPSCRLNVPIRRTSSSSWAATVRPHVT